MCTLDIGCDTSIKAKWQHETDGNSIVACKCFVIKMLLFGFRWQFLCAGERKTQVWHSIVGVKYQNSLSLSHSTLWAIHRMSYLLTHTEREWDFNIEYMQATSIINCKISVSVCEVKIFLAQMISPIAMKWTTNNRCNIRIISAVHKFAMNFIESTLNILSKR